MKNVINFLRKYDYLLLGLILFALALVFVLLIKSESNLTLYLINFEDEALSKFSLMDYLKGESFANCLSKAITYFLFDKYLIFALMESLIFTLSIMVFFFISFGKKERRSKGYFLVFVPILFLTFFNGTTRNQTLSNSYFIMQMALAMTFADCFIIFGKLVRTSQKAKKIICYFASGLSLLMLGNESLTLFALVGSFYVFNELPIIIKERKITLDNLLFFGMIAVSFVLSFYVHKDFSLGLMGKSKVVINSLFEGNKAIVMIPVLIFFAYLIYYVQRKKPIALSLFVPVTLFSITDAIPLLVFALFIFFMIMLAVFHFGEKDKQMGCFSMSTLVLLVATLFSGNGDIYIGEYAFLFCLYFELIVFFERYDMKKYVIYPIRAVSGGLLLILFIVSFVGLNSTMNQKNNAFKSTSGIVSNPGEWVLEYNGYQYVVLDDDLGFNKTEVEYFENELKKKTEANVVWFSQKKMDSYNKALVNSDFFNTYKLDGCYDYDTAARGEWLPSSSTRVIILKGQAKLVMYNPFDANGIAIMVNGMTIYEGVINPGLQIIEFDTPVGMSEMKITFEKKFNGGNGDLRNLALIVSSFTTEEK